MDPTYDRDEIQKNRVWRVAFVLSEFYNDNAPLGWSQYISAAEAVVGALDGGETPAASELRELR